jgi:hypothetical protein
MVWFIFEKSRTFLFYFRSYTSGGGGGGTENLDAALHKHFDGHTILFLLEEALSRPSSCLVC